MSRSARHSAIYLWTHRRLLWRVSASEMRGRYAGSFLGVGWAVLAPVLILAIYAIVYLVIFKVQVPGLSPLGYVLYIFSGLVPYLATAEALALGVSSVVVNKSVLNNTVFPIDLAPAKAVLLSQATLTAGLGMTVIGLAVAGLLHPTVLLVPFLCALMALGLIGVVWILSLLNVVFRDLQNLVTALLMMLLVVSPIAYTPSMVPASLRALLIFNPFAYYVIAYQNLLVLGHLPSRSNLAVIVVGSIGVFVLGGWFFARSKAVLIDYV
jgi:lipopolysaccharide transport system permease protein